VKMTNPHDAFFKESFSRREHAADFLAGVLPAPLKQKLDLDAAAERRFGVRGLDRAFGAALDFVRTGIQRIQGLVGWEGPGRIPRGGKGRYRGSTAREAFVQEDTRNPRGNRRRAASVKAVSSHRTPQGAGRVAAGCEV